VFVACDFTRKELQRDGPSQRRVLGLVDRTHPSATEFLDDAVVNNSSTYERVGARHWADILGCTLL